MKLSDKSQTMPAKGYTIDELRYQRALAMARSEIARMHMVDAYESTREAISNPSSSGGIMGRIMSSLDYIEYVVAGYRIWKKIARIVRRKRAN